MNLNAKYYIFHLVRHNNTLYSSTPKEEAETQTKVNAFFRSWHPRVRQIIGGHALGLAGEWDWMGVFGVDELSDWEAFREEYNRRFTGRTEKSLSLPAVSHQEFTRATADIGHYKELRGTYGMFPGGSEIHEENK